MYINSMGLTMAALHSEPQTLKRFVDDFSLRNL